MPFSYSQFTGNGSTTTYSVSFPYLVRAHVRLYYGLNLTTGGYTTLLVDGVNYTWTSSTQVQITPAPPNGTVLTIRRETPTTSRLVDWNDGSALTAADLDTADLQNFYAIQEHRDFIDAYTINPIAAVPDFSITSIKLSTDAVTTAKIADQNVTTGKIADGAINTAKIIDQNVTTDKISDQAVTTAKVADDAINNAKVAASAGIASSKLNFLQAGTGAVTRTVESKLRDVVSVTDFGAVGDGVADDTAAIQAAINRIASVGGGTVLFPEPSTAYRLTASINLTDYVFLKGQSKRTKIFRNFANGFAFIAANKSYVTIEDFWIYSTTPSTVSPSGGIGIQNGVYCQISNVTIVGMRQYGTWLYDSSYCTVENCGFSGWIGSYLQDSSDIAVLNNSNWNTIKNNKCFGGGDHGILIQDTYAGATPTGNKVIGNTVGEHTAYGIVAYMTTSYNTQTKIVDNEVRDIIGSSLSGTSGAGIYIQSAGGTICTGNTVSNCCRSTSNFFTLSPAGIGITSPSGTSFYPVVVSGNSLDSVRGPCIAAITNGGPVTIEGNACTLVSTDAAANPRSIYVSNSPRCTINGNLINHTSPAPAVNVLARSGLIINDTAILNNTVRASEYGIIVERTDTATHESLRLAGNYVEGPTVQSVQIIRASNCSIIGNIVYGSSIIFELNTSVRSRMEGNSLISTNTTTPVVYFTGVSTGSVFSETNTIVGRVSNDAGSGVIVSQYGSGAPALGGTWNVGDRVIQSAPVVGQPKGWRCTVAGAPGTWVSEGNL